MFNMSFECFMAMITNGIIEFLPSNLSITKNGSSNLKSFYEEYQSETSTKKVLPYLINAARNSRYLKDKPHKFVEDLAVVYKIDCGGNENGRLVVPITYDSIEALEITPEELDQLAMSNLEEMSVNFKTMRDMLIETYRRSRGCDIPEYMLPPEEETPSMYVLTNVYKSDGAVMILNERVMKSILRRIGRDMIIIPCSIHEVIIMPVPENGINTNEFVNLIQDVNASELAPNEILSDHAYLYTKKNGLMSI